VGSGGKLFKNRVLERCSAALMGQCVTIHPPTTAQLPAPPPRSACCSGRAHRACASSPPAGPVSNPGGRCCRSRPAAWPRRDEPTARGWSARPGALNTASPSSRAARRRCAMATARAVGLHRPRRKFDFAHARRPRACDAAHLIHWPPRASAPDEAESLLACEARRPPR
jgi:hypothetical protein